jgi:hypothetical protein
MPVCPPPSRKHTAFSRQRLARGLHGNQGMRTQFLFLSTLLGAVFALAPAAFAQDPNADAITSINGEDPTTDAATIYFNAEDCAAPTETFYDVTLANGDGVNQAYMWAGVQNGECNLETNRMNTSERCRPMASSNPRTVGDNATVTGLTLQELIDTTLVNCANGALEGQPYEIYSFRNEDPGSNNVLPEGYGVAPFVVDVVPPEKLVLTSGDRQSGTTFTISWEAPTDSNSIAQYNLYRDDDPQAIGTAGQNAKSITISAAELDIVDSGDPALLFVSAVDLAAMRLGDGNEGPLSAATEVVYVPTAGFCDDVTVDCSGCSVSPMMLANGQPSSGVWLFGLLFAIVLGRRLHR